MKPIWKPEPDEHDYPAARDFLSLCMADMSRVSELVFSLRDSRPEYRKAKDILRASWLPVLKRSNPHVSRNIAKVERGEKLSPVLLVVDDNLAHPLVIADGYHRVSASYHLAEDTEIPCRIARSS